MSDPNPHLSPRSGYLNRIMTTWSYDDLKGLFEGDENFALYLNEADHEAVFFQAHGRFWLFNHLPTTEVHKAAPEVIIDRIGAAAPKEPGAEPVLMHRDELPNHVRLTVEGVEKDPPEHPYDELERKIGSEDSSDDCEHESLTELDESDRREMWLSDIHSVDCPDCGSTFELEQDDFASELYLVRRP